MHNSRTLSVLASVLIISGLLVTFENYGIISGISVHWPVFLLFSGLGFLMLFNSRGKSDVVLIWLGSFQILLFVFFYYLNWTSWKSLVTLWPVFLGIVGFSFLSVAIYTRKMLFVYSAAAFIALFIIFTLVFSISSRLWPLSFVVFGISLFIIEYLFKKLSLK